MANQIDDIKKNLDTLADEVNNPDISLEDALDKYNEAIELSLKATQLVEEDSAISEILHPEEEETQEQEASAEEEQEEDKTEE